MSRPILPARLAVDTVEEIKGFVSALLYARKTSTYSAILKCLFEDDPMVKGPFISLHLPFVRDTSTAWPLDPLLKEGFAPYAHQSKAFARLSGDHPQHTIVTTGTGSGKSECFILPLMDYVMRCKRRGQSKGVKALIIYPMNALIEDQGERLSEIANRLNSQLSPEQQIRVGRYTGASGQTLSHSPMHPKQIIDDRDTLCADPPDILLTNYKMLDFMLFRPEEQKFWGLDTQNVFRYLVLDELHTFDGAQGADVACLIRRLRLKLRKDFTCIGTSATVAGGGTDNSDALHAGRLQLCKFATTLFGTDIGLDAILGEERLSTDSYLSINPKLSSPTKPLPHKNLLRQGKDAYGDFLKSLCQHWSAPINDIERGLWIRSHPLTLSLLKAEVTGQSLTEIAKIIGIEADLLVEFLDLLASARVDGSPAQVFNLGVQIWVSETGYLLRKLAPEPEFKRYLDKHEDGYLPAVNCQSCGLSGWFTSLEENPSEDESFRLEYDTKKIFQDFFQKDGVVLFPRDAGDTVFDPLNTFCYDLESGLLRRGRTVESRHIPLHVALLSDEHQNSVILSSRRGKGQKDFTRCPECDDPLRLSFSGVSRSMLASVLSSSFLAHGANPDDRKILMFNDSVQDTAHQAGYISARSYRFNLRRVLYRILKELSQDDLAKGLNLADFRQRATRHLAQMWQDAGRERANSKTRQDREKTRELMQLIPKDLWDQWTGSGQGNPLHVDGNQPILIDRILWEFWLELTLHRDLGWSLAKSGLVTVAPTDELIKRAMEVLVTCVARAQIPMLEAPELFLRGFLDHLVTKAVVYHKDLEASYGKQKGKFNLWPLLNAKPHLKSLFGPRTAHPHILSLEPSLGGKHQRSPIQYLTSRKGQTWYQNWVNKHLPAHQDKSMAGKVDHFLDLLVRGLAAHKIGLQSVHPENQVNFVVADNILIVQQVPLHTFQCPRCGAVKMVPRTQNFSEARCEQYRCWGRMEALSPAEESGREAFLAFLSSNYERDVEAPFAHTHTGGLDAADRRRVEQAFKQNLLPGDSMNENGRGAPYYKDHPINVLACTPTLEMGIDIGSLSGVILRGFPRSLASALQRLGRAGRKSGNAFNTILAGRGAHDRYQWSHPLDFFKGSVTAPGCRFRTKDLLRRQFHAYLLDTYVGSKEGLSFPNARNLEDSSDFLHHPFWRDKGNGRLPLCSQVGAGG
jgi:DEAD/DEAH box helicase domain-containing protein